MIYDTQKSFDWLKIKAVNFHWDLFEPILMDERFAVWSASSKPGSHHYGKGGLIYHTAEVCRLCELNNEAMGSPIDPMTLFTAAFYHDVGKMWDYRPTNEEKTEWEGTEHKRNIHHISRSALTFQKIATEMYKVESFKDEVLHAILSHHGLREWGSPVAPNSKLAYLLHLCDSISARLADCETVDQIKRK